MRTMDCWENCENLVIIKKEPFFDWNILFTTTQFEVIDIIFLFQSKMCLEASIMFFFYVALASNLSV